MLLEKECDMIRIFHSMPYKLTHHFIDLRAYKKDHFISLYQHHSLIPFACVKCQIKRETER